MMGNEDSNSSDIMRLIGRIEMQGKICEIKAATPRELNGNRGFRRNINTSTANTTNTTNNDESKKPIADASSINSASSKVVTSPKAIQSSNIPSFYSYPPIPPNQGLPSPFPHSNGFYYSPAFPVMPSAPGYLPPHMEYSGIYIHPVTFGAYMEHSFPCEVSDQMSLPQHPNAITIGEKQQPNISENSLPSKSLPTNTATTEKGVTPSHPPMIHTVGYPLVPATPMLVPPIATPPTIDGNTPTPVTTTSALPVLQDHLPYFPSSYGGIIPGAVGAPTLPPYPPFQLPMASPQIYREGEMYPPLYPYYPTASAVAMGPMEPVITPLPHGIVPPTTLNPTSSQSEETIG
jgi:hypothetical protein